MHIPSHVAVKATRKGLNSLFLTSPFRTVIEPVNTMWYLARKNANNPPTSSSDQFLFDDPDITRLRPSTQVIGKCTPDACQQAAASWEVPHA